MAIDSSVWRELLHVALQINSAGSHASYGEAVVTGLTRVISSDVTVFQALDRKSKHIITFMSPPNCFTREEVTYYAHHSGQHPMAVHYADERNVNACRISDLIPVEDWISSDLFRKCLRRLSLVHTLGVPIYNNASINVGLSFSRRDPDFTKEHCELLDAFAPHLRLAWKNHPSPWADRRELESRVRLQSLGLSPHESEVLFWVTEGKLNREIAMLLKLSLWTVQEHVKNIVHKLDMENRHQLAVFAIGKLQGK